jgi:prepilin-type N-terminal cleavage/methylation domain-containing protein
MRWRRGFTMMELLLVVIVIAVLAGMLLPAIGLVKTSTVRVTCGNNQRQIVIAMLAYANDNDSRWPVRPTRDGLYSLDPAAMETALASFEYLAALNGTELPSKLFSCPNNPRFRPPRMMPAIDYDKGVSTWATAKGDDVAAFCYDWSVPSNADALRVVTADRAAERFAHKSKIVVCYSDGHIGAISQSTVPLTGPNRTANIDGSEFTYGWLGEKDDQLYDDAGDGGGMMGEGTGSATRAWVK